MPAVGATSVTNVEGKFPNFTVGFFTGHNHEPDRSLQLAQR
jgi:hypothetical protein